MRGRFITFEGGEGSGKSTQVRLLAAALSAAGHEVVTTREPGGSAGAEAIRGLLVDGEPDRWDGLTEALLHYAARRDHLRLTILPALERGAWVVCDRFNDSTLAYQGFGHGMARETLDTLYGIVAGSLMPDLTLVLDVPVAAGLERAGSRGGGEDRYERMNGGFHDRLRDGFLTIAADNPDRCRVVSGLDAPDVVHATVLAHVRAALQDSHL